MNKNPYLNAVYAGTYIVLLVAGAFSTSTLGGNEPNMLYPIIALSLFVLSAAMMGYFFVVQPAMLYTDGKKKEALEFFKKTVATFAGICVLFILILFLMS